MTTALSVLSALRQLVSTAVPGADVRGFIEDASMPEQIEETGTILGDRGDPGTPEVELSPLAYTFWHRVPVECALPMRPGDDDAVLEGWLSAIGTAMAANRTLGGLVTFLDADPPTYSTDSEAGLLPLRVARFEFIAEYTVNNPLSG